MSRYTLEELLVQRDNAGRFGLDPSQIELEIMAVATSETSETDEEETS